MPDSRICNGMFWDVRRWCLAGRDEDKHELPVCANERIVIDLQAEAANALIQPLPTLPGEPQLVVLPCAGWHEFCSVEAQCVQSLVFADSAAAATTKQAAEEAIAKAAVLPEVEPEVVEEGLALGTMVALWCHVDAQFFVVRIDALNPEVAGSSIKAASAREGAAGHNTLTLVHPVIKRGPYPCRSRAQRRKLAQ